MNVWTQRALLTLLVGLLTAAGGAAWVYRSLWSHYDSAQNQLQSRSERLDGVISVGPDIESTLQSLRDNLQPWLRADGEAAQNDTQRLRELISASGSTLISSQVALEPAAEGKLAAVRLTATVAGDWIGAGAPHANPAHHHAPCGYAPPFPARWRQHRCPGTEGPHHPAA